MTMSRFCTVIVGQGLAGTALAWALRRRGRRVLVLDREEPATASRIAAGLVTPITGMRFVKSRRFDELFAAAVSLYRHVEEQTNADLFRIAPAVRLFAGPDERESFRRRAERDDPEDVRVPEQLVDEARLHAADGGFEMLRAARLDVPRYLAASRDVFRRGGGYLRSDIHPGDLEWEDRTVVLPRLGVRCDRVVFCQGFAAAENPWFRNIPFDAAKGEALTVRIAGLNEDRVLQRGIWLAPLGNDLYKVGATYHRDRLDCECTDAGRTELCDRLRQLLRVPFEVVGQEAAVRPILQNKRPAVGFHLAFPQLGYFNGLASKGVLQAPWFAEHLAAAIAGKTELLPEFDVSRRAELTPCD